MNVFMGAGIAIFVAWAYFMFGRPLLVKRFPGAFDRINAIEGALWKNSKTLLVARFYWVGGLAIGAHDWLAQNGFDMTPMLNEIAAFIPEQYRPLALAGFLFFSGIIFEWLRWLTTEPVVDDVASAESKA